MESRPRSRYLPFLAVFLAPLLLAATASAAREDLAAGARRATGSLSGIVVANGSPVAGAIVTETRTGESVQADSAGRFVLSGMPAGRTTLSVTTGAGTYLVRVQSSHGGHSRGIISIGTIGGAGGSAAVLLPIQAGGHEGAEIEGPVTANDGTTLTVNDQDLGPVAVTTDANTVIRHGNTVLNLADITVGMTVHVKAALQADGVTYLAGEILVQDENTGGGSGGGDNETELSGTVSALDCGAGTMVLTTDSGDVNVTFDANTVFKSKGQVLTCGDLAVGDDAEVDGALQTDGSVLAAKVSFEAPETENTELQGIIKSISAPDFVLTTDSGDVTIHTDSSTVFKSKGQTKTFADLAVGDDAEVTGALQGDGSVNATKVSFEPPETEDVEIQGTVKSVSAPNFVVTTDSGDVTVATDGSTQFFTHGHDTATFADVVVGASVEVDGALQGDGSVLASKVKIENGGGGGGGGD